MDYFLYLCNQKSDLKNAVGGQPMQMVATLF